MMTPLQMMFQIVHYFCVEEKACSVETCWLLAGDPPALTATGAPEPRLSPVDLRPAGQLALQRRAGRAGWRCRVEVQGGGACMFTTLGGQEVGSSWG